MGDCVVLGCTPQPYSAEVAMKQLKAQVWHDWLRMAEKTLAGAGRIAWQGAPERQVEIELFGKVTGFPPMHDSRWRNSMTWTAATLLGLSIEQGLKALAIRRSQGGEMIATHDLVTLWEMLPEEDHRGIAEEAGQFRKRTAGTRFGDAPDLSEVNELLAVIQHHRMVFGSTRYHLEMRGSVQGRELTDNLGLWVVAIATYCYAKRLQPDIFRRLARGFV